MRLSAPAFVFAAVLALASWPAAAQDMIDPATIQIVNAPDFKPWTVAATFTDIDVDMTGHVTFHLDGQNCDLSPTRCWPTVIAPKGPIQFTIWLFLQINGRWVGSGFIEGINTYNAQSNYFDTYARDWYYGTAWNPMSGHVIQEGETIGFMFGGGDQRYSVGPNSGIRSNIVTLPATHGSHPFGAAPPFVPATPPPAPTPVPPVVSPAPVVDLSSLTDALARLQASLDDATAQRAAFADDATAQRREIKTIAQQIQAQVQTLQPAPSGPSMFGQVGSALKSPAGMILEGLAGMWFTCHQSGKC